MSDDCYAPPPHVLDCAMLAVDYVERSTGLELTFDSETLPILDHYVAQAPTDQPAARQLVVVTAGAYFGEVVRRAHGGSWLADDSDEPTGWRLVLPGGLSFCPAGLVAAALACAEVEELDCQIDAPPAMRELIEPALAAMSPVGDATYYTLSGRYDTLEHLMDVVLSNAGRLAQLEAGATPASPGNGARGNGRTNGRKTIH